MSSNTNNNFDCDSSFDCSYYLGHGIELPHDDGYNFETSPVELLQYADACTRHLEEQDYNFSAAKLKQFEHNESSRRSSTEDYYPLEYNDLLSCMNQCDMDNFTMNKNELNRLRELTAIDKGLLPASGAPHLNSDFFSHSELTTHGLGVANLESMLWKEMEENDLQGDATHYENVMIQKSSYHCSLHFQNLAGEYLDGFGVKEIHSVDIDHSELVEEDQNRKRRLCRHFLKGHCKRGKACDFLHDPSIFCPNSQKVFLGGLPTHITEVTLRQKLAEQGYKVINKPKVLRGFTPQVCMASVEDAQKLIKKRNILIDGSLVDVRAYEAFAKGGIDESRPDEMKRSVFLGGLPKGTTSQMIKEDLQKMDVKVINNPLVKTGFTPKVTFGTVKETNMLIKLKKVRINETLVDVRPYVNFKSPCRSSKKK